MNQNGTIAKGWIWDGWNWYYMNNTGKMYTGWLKIDSDWYYLLPSGEMAAGSIEINGQPYVFSDNGILLERPDDDSGHQHRYYENEWKVAGCGEPLYITWQCSCGDRYLEVLPFLPEYHLIDWLEEIGRKPVDDDHPEYGEIPILQCPICGYETEGDYV